MRILIVEDEEKLARAIKRGLEQQSYAVDMSFDGDSGLSMASTEPYDLIILDRMLPGSVDGIGILKTLRKENIQTPVLFLTAKDKVLDKTEGLNAGADDYLAKPFAFVELLARVRALLRRPAASIESVLNYSDLSLDTVSKTATRADKQIELTVKEYALLDYFLRNPERVISKDEIVEHVWNFDAHVLPNTVEVYVGYLRTKFDKPFKEHLIHTKRGFGYYFGSKV